MNQVVPYMVGVKVGQDGMEVVPVLLKAATIYKDIIKVHNYVLIEHVKKDLVHQTLKGWWSVGEPEGHHHPLKKAISGQKKHYNADAHE